MAQKLNFSLTQIEYILAVYKTGHFAKAAELCNVTQPTLSMQIKKLEEDLGVTIFDRSKKPILLTQSGALIIEQLQTLVFEAKKISSLIEQGEKKDLNGELIVGMIPTISPYLLPRLLPVVQKLYPRLSLRLREMQTEKIIEALETDEIDVGCLATPLGKEKVIEYPLYYEPFYAVCKKDHELAQVKRLKHSHLKFNDLWLLEEGHCLRAQILDVCSLKKSQKLNSFNFESGNLETLKNIVNSYGGYTLLPALATEQLGQDVVLIPFERPIPSRQIGLVHRRVHFKNDLIEALGEAITQSLPEEIRKLRPKDLDVLPVE